MNAFRTLHPAELNDSEALVVLITAESLLLAVISVIVVFSRGGRDIPDLPAKPFTLGIVATGFLVAIAVGAIAAWWGLYIGSWPCSFRGSLIALAVAIAAVTPPIFAAVITRGLRPKR
jgi:hypothetical protein